MKKPQANGTEPPPLIDDPRGEDFALEPPPKPGTVPPRVVDELRHCYRRAADFAAAFADAVKAQAEKHNVAAKALRRYVVAVEGNKLEELETEADDLARLIDESHEPALVEA